jgi:hypothetical protein
MTVFRATVFSNGEGAIISDNGVDVCAVTKDGTEWNVEMAGKQRIGSTVGPLDSALQDVFLALSYLKSGKRGGGKPDGHSYEIVHEKETYVV